MDLYDLCVRMAELQNIDVDNEMTAAFAKWQEVFGRPVYSFTDFVDAMETCNVMEDVDLNALHRVWHQSHEMDKQAVMTALEEESSCGTYQLWGN